MFDYTTNSDSLNINFWPNKKIRIEIYGRDRESIKVSLTKENINFTSIYLDTAGNILKYKKVDNIGKSKILNYYENNKLSNKLKVVAFFDKKCYINNDSVILFLRGANRRYEKMIAKVYILPDSSVYDSRTFPKIFEKLDMHDADSIDQHTLLYKFKFVKSQKNRLVIRMFCYDPIYSCEVQFQGEIADINIPICTN